MGVYELYTLKAPMAIHIETIIIDDPILEKIQSKHSVTFGEAEEVCLGPERHIRRGREGLYKVFGRSGAGRYLLFVLANLGGGLCKLATARDMTDQERRLYRQTRGGN